MSQRLAVSQSVDRLGGEEQRHHRADTGRRDAARRPLGGRACQPVGQPGGELLEPVVGIRVAEHLERGDAGGRGQRIAAERAGLKDLAGRQHVVHDLGPAAVGAHRQPAADDLAQRGQVGRDAEAAPAPRRRPRGSRSSLRRRSAAPRACAVSSRSACRNSAVGTTQPMLPTTGSTITPAICGPCSANACFQARRRRCSAARACPGRAGGHARRVGHAERGRRAAGRHQQAVDVAVIVAGELDDHVAAGEAAGQADRAHRGLGAGVDQPDLLDRRHGLDDQLGQFAFGLGRGAEAGAAARAAASSAATTAGWRVAQDHRPPRADVVDVAIAVDVEQIGPLAALEEDRLAADAAEGPGRAVDAAGHELFRGQRQRWLFSRDMGSPSS